MNIELKLLNIGDADKWLELQREIYRPYLETHKDIESHPAADTIDMIIERIKNSSYQFYFAYSARIIVGGIRIIWREDKKEFEIADLYVVSEFQKSGNGKKIVKMAEELYPYATSWKVLAEPKNHQFYGKCGYRKANDVLTIDGEEALYLLQKE